jgi:hypothetical protein
MQIIKGTLPILGLLHRGLSPGGQAGGTGCGIAAANNIGIAVANIGGGGGNATRAIGGPTGIVAMAGAVGVAGAQADRATIETSNNDDPNARMCFGLPLFKKHNPKRFTCQMAASASRQRPS